MGCCGGRTKPSNPHGYGYIHVRWEGKTPLRVVGGVTGNKYRFDGYGSVVAIDQRDQGNVKSIPGMKVVS
jgi:hypothetical protein